MRLLRERREPTGFSSPARLNGDRNKLTAAGQKLTQSVRRQPDLSRARWQEQAFYYYDVLGEIKYAAQFYSRALAKLRLFAAEFDDQGEVVETANEQAIEQLARVQDQGGGRSTLLATYGRLMFLVGESLLFVSKDEETDEEQWEFLSTDELRRQGDTYMRFRRPSLPEEYKAASDDDFEPVADDEAVAYRIWRRHPRYSSLPDSTMQGVLELCEEIMLLTRAVRGRARSRLAGAGILAIPDSLTQRPLDSNASDEDPDEDPFLAELTEHMTAPIAEEGSASAVVPLVIRGPAEDLAAITHLQVIDPMQMYPETGLRMELIKRLAIGLDLPPEILLGLQDSNHWSAWQIDEQTWKAHLQPIAQYLVDDLTAAFFRPQLKQLGVSDWQRYTIAYDAAEVINHPDRTKDAKDLHDRAVLSDEALRETAGFDDDDAPSEEEVNRRIGILVRDSSLALYGIPSVRSGGIEPEPGDIVSGNGTGPTSAETVKGPPAGGSDVPQEESVQAAARARLLGAADLTMRRARERAGQRLLSLAKRDPEVRKLITGPTTCVASTLGAEVCAQLGAPEAVELVAGAAELFAEAVRELIPALDVETAHALGVQIERHAAKTLWEAKPAPIPASFAHYVLEVTS
jgi:hypothetical protein